MEPKPKRIKIDVACDTCRRRKVKCDGARPGKSSVRLFDSASIHVACGNCWKRTDLKNGCTYTAEAEKSISGGSKPADASPGNPERAMPKIVHTPETNFVQPVMPPISRSTPSATPKSTASSGPGLTRRGRGERHSTIIPSDASSSVVDSMTTVREDGTVTSEYFGSSSAGSFTNQIKAAIDARLGSSTTEAGSVRSSFFRSTLPLNGAGPGGQADYVLPARKQADHLTDRYWYYVDPLYPFLDRQRFEHSYRALFAGTSLDADERIFVSTLNIVFALSTQLIESLPADQRDSSSQGYFTRAQDLLQLSLWDTGSIELIQCLLIMSQPNLTRLTLLMSLMTRMIAITHGRPAMISDQMASSVVFPSIPDTNTTSLDGVKLGAVQLHKLRYQAFFHKSLELYEVINHAVLAFYSSTSPLKSPTYTNGTSSPTQRSANKPELDLGKALQLDQRLTIWEKSLPSFLTVAEPETSLDEIFRRQAVILRIRLLHARMLLLRPMLTRFCLSQSPESSQVHDDLSSRVVQQCAMVCVEAAQSLISFISQFQRHNSTLGLLPAWWYRVFYIYTAATVLIAARLRPAVFSSLDISRSWNQAISLLHDHENLGPSPRRCAAALQILSKKMFQGQHPQSAAPLNPETTPAVASITNERQETFDMPLPYLAHDAAFDMDAITFDINDFSWLNSMPGSL
ncbi:fungal specific transcription factor [Colletotrichum orchidophilum]|uniref:Fungal specific transcription factor n=1 Tax=Colletotrichum orchidophilum TaxID=1209926 RepID=A0A1G4BAH9_9PEZI|nr:fungal specific transcription factor [Colletotrichum orchidophilum]OHE98302.1 fungal specific transcription factor [Colletotrichum orchidophilum]